jgi:hypothetical protein
MGALEPLDGTEVTYSDFQPDGPPAALETTEPRKRGFLKAALAAERARVLLQAPAPPAPPPSAVGLLGRERTKVLWDQATRWPGWRWAFCRHHGIVPSTEADDGGGRRCYLGCSLDTPGVA